MGASRQVATASLVRDRDRGGVSARSALREVPRAARHPEKRRATVPIRALYGVNDAAIHESWTSPENAIADDFTLEKVDDTSHFIMEERPDLVRARLIALAAETRV